MCSRIRTIAINRIATSREVVRFCNKYGAPSTGSR
jgi:hypothetical protein